MPKPKKAKPKEDGDAPPERSFDEVLAALMKVRPKKKIKPGASKSGRKTRSPSQ